MKEFKLPFDWNLCSDAEYESDFDEGSEDNDTTYDSEEDIEYDEAAEDNDTAYDIEFLQLLGQV